MTGLEVAVRRDPAIIRFNANRGGSDMFWIHGNFRASKDVDFTTDRFAIILSNENGIIYQGTLVPGVAVLFTAGRFRGGAGWRGGRANSLSFLGA